MCRLYGLHASHPTTPSCELLDAQNSLLEQSIKDERGFSNHHGWGIGHVLPDGSLDCERQVDPAHDSAGYRKRASEIESISIVAHVRRATIGGAKLENTHPFRDDGALLVHNGHISFFKRVRPILLEAMGEASAAEISGETDSEHVFRLLLSRMKSRERAALVDVLAATADDLDDWARAEGADVALNLIWCVGEEIVGTRFGHSLEYVERDHAYECPVCGRTHAPDDADDYRAVIVASEEITAEPWTEVGDRSVWWVDDDFRLRTREL